MIKINKDKSKITYWTTRREDVQRNIALESEHYNLNLMLFVSETIGCYGRRKGGL